MRKTIVSVAVIILSIITINSSNFILLGDFQNIVPINNYYIHCANVCNQTWFTANGPIQLGNQISPMYTINADLSNDINYKLCQNVSSMPIGKTFIFTFDMMCDSYSQNCSVWVIVNDQMVNGTNYTIYYDHFPHKAVGYFNSILSNNTICFQSSEAPSMPWYGTRLDNVTLQVFNDLVPCYVSGCESCVLNFPNSCYICQTGYLKQPNQNCTMCSTIISNCARCQRINNQYTCLQCSSQFSLNTQINFCYRNSEMFFTSEVQQTASIGNGFIIKTNLSMVLLIQAGFTIQNLPSIVIQIDRDKQQNLTITINEEGFLEVKFIIARQYLNFDINFLVEQGFIQINNTYFSIRTSVTKKPSVFLSEIQIAIFQKYDEIAKPIIQNLDVTFAIIKNSGLGFFIASIFNYLNLMTFYSYLNMYQPKTFRLFIESLSSQLNSYSLYKFINLQTQVYEVAQYQVTEKIKVSSQEWLGPLQTGFSTNFYKNNLQPFTIIAIFAIRLGLCWILHKIFKASFLQSSKCQRFVSISSQFHTIIPIIILPSFNLIIKSIASINYLEKINTILHTIVVFICLIIPFVHLITQLQQVERKILENREKLQIEIKNSKQKSTNEILQFQVQPGNVINLQVQKEFDQRRNQLNQEQKNGLIQVKFKLVQKLKLLSIPIFVVFQQVLPFLVTNLCLLLIIFVLSLKLKKYLSVYEFLFNTIISLAWVLLHCCFCVFFIIQNWFLDQESESTVIQVLKYVSYSSIVIILFGAVVQMLDCLIGIIDIFRKIVIYLYKKYKESIKITPQHQSNKQSICLHKKNKQQIKKMPQDKKKKQKINSQYAHSNNTGHKKYINIGVEQKKAGKKVITQNTNSKQNEPVMNRELFHFYQPQALNKSTKISKFNRNNIKIQNQTNKQNAWSPAMNQLFHFNQPQTQNKNSGISNFNYTKKGRKIKKTKEQVNILHLRVKFINQN